MSLDANPVSTKRAALEQLRFSKFTKSRAASVQCPTTSSSSVPPSQPVPPSQSRDATLPSRYFALASTSHDVVLAPNSSPLNPAAGRSPYRPYHRPSEYDVATMSTLFAPNPWRHNEFAVENNGIHASQHLSDGNWYYENPGEDEPPRKRVNYGLSQSTGRTLDSPDSPNVQRPGQRRRVLNGNDALSSSSDESISDISHILPGSSKPRITRGRRTDVLPTTEPIQSETEDPRLTHFLVTMPLHSPSRARAAWHQANGDVNRATQLLSDPGWDPTPSQQSSEGTGRVKEIDEATKAERAAAKEKGKKSMIYANRSILGNELSHTTPPRPMTITDLTASSPLSPIIAQSRPKRITRVVVDSDSEVEIIESDKRKNDESTMDMSDDSRALQYFNSANPEALQELTGCTIEQARAIIEQRPFFSISDLNEKLGQGRKRAGLAGISPRMFEDCMTIFEGYGAVDNILEDCERIGATLRRAIASWTSTDDIYNGMTQGNALGDPEDGALSLCSLAPLKGQPTAAMDHLVTQPALLSHDVQLKEYQLLGVNWLQLLYRRNLSCILADEMGLGKTIQVISFFALLKEQGNRGPHLVVVPSSTLENWCREFARFAPSISVQTYYAGKEERPLLRQTLLDTQRSSSKNDGGWEILITTYNLAQGDDRDRKFFRRVEWDTCVFDEGHVLKNFQSQRYQALLRYASKWRLLLTGTPLQNNLQELVSLMNFILPGRFAHAMESLRTIFKVKGDSKITMLSQERVSRAKKMMTPFVLRRRKDQVLKDLPKKTERIEWCEMSDLQRTIYTDTIRRSRKTVLDDESTKSDAHPSGNSKRPRKNDTQGKNSRYLENSSNVLMDLRKAASHPMLFRTGFTDAILVNIAKQLMKEADFKDRGANFDFVREDMEVMTDAELQIFCAMYKSTRKYVRNTNCYLESGKISALMRLLDQYGKEGRKILIFSQFTQILDILQAILKQNNIKYLLLTGSTAVDIRQTLVDEFTDDESIPVFLLSTKAGGMGINLTAASVVIMFDQDFNPHNDKQAQDRAYRIGQKRDVEVVKLITRGTIEEDMLKLGETKLALDEAVAGDNDEVAGNGENAYEKEMKTSLMNVLRKQFASQDESDVV